MHYLFMAEGELKLAQKHGNPISKQNKFSTAEQSET
jgi:hypothetical protein